MWWISFDFRHFDVCVSIEIFQLTRLIHSVIAFNADSLDGLISMDGCRSSENEEKDTA